MYNILDVEKWNLKNKQLIEKNICKGLKQKNYL